MRRQFTCKVKIVLNRAGDTVVRFAIGGEPLELATIKDIERVARSFGVTVTMPRRSQKAQA